MSNKINLSEYIIILFIFLVCGIFAVVKIVEEEDKIETLKGRIYSLEEIRTTEKTNYLTSAKNGLILIERQQKVNDSLVNIIKNGKICN